MASSGEKKVKSSHLNVKTDVITEEYRSLFLSEDVDTTFFNLDKLLHLFIWFKNNFELYKMFI